MSAQVLSEIKKIVQSAGRGFDKATVISDYEILNRGVKRAAIIFVEPHEPNDEYAMFGVPARKGKYRIEIFTRYTTQEESVVDVIESSDAIYAKLAEHTEVAGASQLSVSGFGDVSNVFNQSGKGPFFVMTTISLSTIEHLQVSFE